MPQAVWPQVLTKACAAGSRGGRAHRRLTGDRKWLVMSQKSAWWAAPQLGVPSTRHHTECLSHTVLHVHSAFFCSPVLRAGRCWGRGHSSGPTAT